MNKYKKSIETRIIKLCKHIQIIFFMIFSTALLCGCNNKLEVNQSETEIDTSLNENSENDYQQLDERGFEAIKSE